MPRRLPLVNKLPRQLGDAVLIIGLANLGVFAICFVGFFVLRSKGFVEVYHDWLALSARNVLSGKVWTLLTYGFLHDLDTLMHIPGNMIGLYFLGPPIERRFGKRAMLKFWLGAVLGGGILAFLADLVGPADTLTFGASAGTIALVGAWSWIYPNQTLLLMFIIPVPARHLVKIVVVLDLLFAFSGSDVSVAAHFGGLIAAWLMIHGWTRPDRIIAGFNRFKARAEQRQRQRKRKKFRVIPGGNSDDEPMIH
jgi:membrane associated rhomboid family serine protease